MSHEDINISEDVLADFCRRRQVTEFALFGSALRNDFRPDSDIDVLVTFSPDARHSLFDLAEMETELERMLGRRVDLVEKAGIRNPFRRHTILKSSKILYAS